MFWTKFWKNAINNLLVHFSVNNRLKLKQCSFHKGRLTKAWRGGGGFEWILASLSHKILLPYYVTHIKFSIVFNMTFIKTCVLFYVVRDTSVCSIHTTEVKLRKRSLQEIFFHREYTIQHQQQVLKSFYEVTSPSFCIHVQCEPCRCKLFESCFRNSQNT